jgi:hypothetical protein
MQEGKFAEACPKFEASQRLDPGVGTLLNLGDCFEHAGKTASAWASFREAASLAVAASQAERERAARERAQALEPRLVRLVVKAPPAAASDAGFRIVRDDVVVEREAWGTAVPIDPGKHVIRASAPGKRAWSTELSIDSGAAGTTRTVDVPALAIEAAPTPKWSPQRTVGLVVGGLGVIALGVGTGFAIDAKSNYDEAHRRCTPNGCDSAARSRADSAISTADAATGMFIGGAVALAAGVVLFLTAPSHSTSARSIGVLPQLRF